MAVTSQRIVINKFTGDYTADSYANAADNAASPGDIDVVTLSAGFNSITPPAGAKAVTILFPAGNTVLVTLKGIAADTGVALHLTDPTSIGLNSVAAFGLNAVAQLVGLRLIWS